MLCSGYVEVCQLASWSSWRQNSLPPMPAWVIWSITRGRVSCTVMLVGAIVIGLLGVASKYALVAVEQRLFRWRNTD